MKLDQIFNGYANLLTGKQKELAEQRLTKCAVCPMRTKAFCDPKKSGVHVLTGKRVTGCGCLLRAKVRAVNAECPAGKW